MFYDYNEVSENLSCSYCSRRFTGVVKLVPQCGNSICGDCFEALMSDLDESREFQCKLCDHQTHTMPAEGLPNNNSLMKMINMEIIEKPLNAKTMTLKATIEGVQQKIEKLESYDGRFEVNTYCDLLEGEVMITVESSIKHLNKLRDDLLTKIDSYRKERLECLAVVSAPWGMGTSFNGVKSEIRIVSEEFKAFKKEWTEYFIQLKVSRNDEEIDKAQQLANDFNRRTASLEKSIRELSFDNKFMKFNENESFSLAGNHLGELIIPSSFFSSTGQVKSIFSINSPAGPAFSGTGIAQQTQAIQSKGDAAVVKFGALSISNLSPKQGPSRDSAFNIKTPSQVPALTLNHQSAQTTNSNIFQASTVSQTKAVPASVTVLNKAFMK